MRERDYSHVSNVTTYMKWVMSYIEKRVHGRSGGTLLDIPAGNGWISSCAISLGLNVTSADINSEKPDYHFCNMDEELPFPDNSYDFVVTLEGIEHLVFPSRFLQELCRVTKPGGSIIISTPNVSNFWSRLHFLFTGCLYQFNANGMRLTGGRLIDRGHISPMSAVQLTYLMSNFGSTLVAQGCDRFKKKWLFPFWMLMRPITWLASKKVFSSDQSEYFRSEIRVEPVVNGKVGMFSRSMILVFRKDC
jgi:SAM-dependent methyltransferase